MSSYISDAYHPVEKVVRAAWWMDDYFGPHDYGIQFDDKGRVFRLDEVVIPHDIVFTPKEKTP